MDQNGAWSSQLRTPCRDFRNCCGIQLCYFIKQHFSSKLGFDRLWCLFVLGFVKAPCSSSHRSLTKYQTNIHVLHPTELPTVLLSQLHGSLDTTPTDQHFIFDNAHILFNP